MYQWGKQTLGNELTNVWRERCGSGVNVVCKVTEQTVDWEWPLSCISDCSSACFIFPSIIKLSNFHFLPLPAFLEKKFFWIFSKSQKYLFSGIQQAFPFQEIEYFTYLCTFLLSLSFSYLLVCHLHHCVRCALHCCLHQHLQVFCSIMTAAPSYCHSPSWCFTQSCNNKGTVQ